MVSENNQKIIIMKNNEKVLILLFVEDGIGDRQRVLSKRLEVRLNPSFRGRWYRSYTWKDSKGKEYPS